MKLLLWALILGIISFALSPFGVGLPFSAVGVYLCMKNLDDAKPLYTFSGNHVKISSTPPPQHKFLTYLLMCHNIVSFIFNLFGITGTVMYILGLLHVSVQSL